MIASLETSAWYALSVKPRHEKAVATVLRAKGYKEFLPLYTHYHRSGRRITPAQLPLLPGYVFASFDVWKRGPIIQTPGIQYIVGNGKFPAAVESDEIAGLQAAVASGLDVRPATYFEVGKLVLVERGALCGIEGLLVGFKGKHRLVLSVTLLRRSISVEVDDSWVTPVRRCEFLSAASAAVHSLDPAD